jgi:hypothetical protein
MSQSQQSAVISFPAAASKTKSEREAKGAVSRTSKRKAGAENSGARRQTLRRVAKAISTGEAATKPKRGAPHFLKGAATPPPDRELIRDCVAFAQAIGGFYAGFVAESTGNSDFAGGPSGNRMFNRAHKLLAAIASRPATTAMGLQSKAGIVPLLVQDNEGVFEDSGLEFLLSFASEVKEFLEPLVREEERAADVLI